MFSTHISEIQFQYHIIMVESSDIGFVLEKRRWHDLCKYSSSLTFSAVLLPRSGMPNFWTIGRVCATWATVLGTSKFHIC